MIKTTMLRSTGCIQTWLCKAVTDVTKTRCPVLSPRIQTRFPRPKPSWRSTSATNTCASLMTSGWTSNSATNASLRWLGNPTPALGDRMKTCILRWTAWSGLGVTGSERVCARLPSRGSAPMTNLGNRKHGFLKMKQKWFLLNILSLITTF